MKNLFLLAFFAFVCLGVILLTGGNSRATLLEQGEDIMMEKPEGHPSAVLAGGCFWCTESEFRALDGVLYTRAGYMGGSTDNPTYKDITIGKTGHAEVIEVTFDPAIISYETIVEFFFTDAHDPTQLNRQGVDRGTQYRSAIFPADDEQKEIAQDVIERLQPEFDSKIVTTIEPFSTFWEAEDYHQQYYEKYQAETGKDHIRVVIKNAKKLKP
ncbi:MAG: peptide-methionine (S)-S-oxide reductase MsrA [Bdellovibrionales bacterium]